MKEWELVILPRGHVIHKEEVLMILYFRKFNLIDGEEREGDSV